MVYVFFGVFACVVFSLTLFEVVGLLVIGKFLPDSRVVPFLDAYLHEYELNGSSSIGVYGSPNDDLPFISKGIQTVFSKWYINGYGRTFRWGKASKLIDQYHEQLLLKEPMKESSFI